MYAVPVKGRGHTNLKIPCYRTTVRGFHAQKMEFKQGINRNQRNEVIEDEFR